MPAPLSDPIFPSTRREFIARSGRGLGLLALSGLAPALLARTTVDGGTGGRILVLVQLTGGNDGLNTVVPYEDADYYRLRPTLALAKGQVLWLSDTLGLHPSCAALHALFGEGKLAVVQNVGYPQPNRSHFRSTEIWETASASDEFRPDSWIGRYLDHAGAGLPVASRDALGLCLRSGLPRFCRSHPHGEASGPIPALEPVIDAYRPAVPYPANSFAGALRQVAALMAADRPTRIYRVALSGFDTHSNQAHQHANLLATLSTGLAAFQRDLERQGLADQVCTLTWSEFGRRPGENESRGTDHGTAAPLFLLGTRLRGGLHGTAPSLQLAPEQDLAHRTDFRRVYATLLERWLGCPAAAVLGGEFRPLPLV